MTFNNMSMTTKDGTGYDVTACDMKDPCAGVYLTVHNESAEATVHLKPRDMQNFVSVFREILKECRDSKGKKNVL